MLRIWKGCITYESETHPRSGDHLLSYCVEQQREKEKNRDNSFLSIYSRIQLYTFLTVTYSLIYLVRLFSLFALKKNCISFNSRKYWLTILRFTKYIALKRGGRGKYCNENSINFQEQERWL